MNKIWDKTLDELSGNLTTNGYMPKKIKAILLEEDVSLSQKFELNEIIFPELHGNIGKIKGMNILAGLQQLQKENFLTVFRAIRFPTNKRMFEMISEKGCAIPNFEQDRILELYKNTEYINKRKDIQKDHNFWVLPQERVVQGLPVFRLVNDAIQIHHAFRHKVDKVLVIAMYIPSKLLESKEVKLISNSAIDLTYDNADRDFEIKDYDFDDGIVKINLESLRARGIDLHEMYLKDLPWGIESCEKHGIEQDYFLLDIYELENSEEIKKLHEDTETLLENNYFLHGFFGDQSVFARRSSRYLPYKCSRIEVK